MIWPVSLRSMPNFCCRTPAAGSIGLRHPTRETSWRKVAWPSSDASNWAAAACEEKDMTTQTEKADAFRKLHEPGSCFVIPNPWDFGSARLLEHLGFKALASSSAGFAFSIAKSDLNISKRSLMTHLTGVCQATSLPVSADLQNGFGNDPEDMAVTILQAAKTGIVGGSIEDASGDEGNPIYPLELAAERIRHAAVAAKSLGFKFTLTARAENHLYGRSDLKDTIRRLQAYQEAGADVLFAPGVQSRDDIRQLVSAVDRP